MDIGERVAQARAESGLTQAQLASAVGLERSALAKIETGARRVSAVELVAIARELRRRIEWFVEAGPQAIVSYRASRSEVAVQAIDNLLDEVVRDVEFVASLVPGLIKDPPAPENTPRTAADAEELALRARWLLGLAPDQPVGEVAQMVSAIGLLPFAVHLGAGADAGTVLLESGGVSIVNGDLKVGGRRLALAHELGHYLIADPYTTDWRVSATDADALESRLDRFARGFLLPESDLRAKWAAWVDLPDEKLRDAAVRAGSHYRVDMATLARRLAELRIVDSGQADQVRRAQTKRSDIVEKNLVVHDELEPVWLPRPFEQAVLRLYRSEIILLDRALGLLRGTFDPDGLPDLPSVPEAEIWTFTS